MKNTNILNKINNFLNHYYPNSSGVLLFGSASFKVKNFQDIDLLIIDEKFSYTSKSSIYYLNDYFNIIKISNYDNFNILAEDYMTGIYRNIFSTGFIIKDEIKLLAFTKEYINKSYPDDYQVVAHNLNNCIYKINEYIRSFNKNLPLIEHFFTFGNLISLIIDFIILQDGKINFVSSKHKLKYLHQFHFNESIIINDIIKKYKKNTEEAFIEIINFIKLLKIPQTDYHCNDYLVENVDNLDSNIIYIACSSDDDFCNNLQLYLTTLDISYYSYWIDKNNIEKAGFYFVIKNLDENCFSKIRNKLENLLSGILFYFPYNLAFRHEIKFGGHEYCEITELLLFNIQPIINTIRNNQNKYLRFVLFVIGSMNISLGEIEIYYFYKTINSNHNLSMKDILEKEKTYKMNIEKTQKQILLNKEEIKFNMNIRN